MKEQKKWVVSLNKFDKGLANIEEIICTIMLLACICVIMMAVVCRFILKYSTPWSEEFTRFMWISMAFFGMGCCLTNNEHIEIDIFSAVMKNVKDLDKRLLIYRIDDLFKYLFIGVLGGWLLLQYINYTTKQFAMNQISAGLHLPMGYLYALLTVGFFLLTLHCILNIIIIIGDYSVLRTKEDIYDAIAEGGDK